MGKVSEAPLCDNPSGEWCKACRECGLSHCAYPEECDGLRPMKHHKLCHHWPEAGRAAMQEDK